VGLYIVHFISKLTQGGCLRGLQEWCFTSSWRILAKLSLFST